MANVSQAEDAAVVRRHGEEGARYLDHLQKSSDNPYLQRAIDEVKRDAREAEQELAGAPRR